jgi:hypothetical protein
MHSVNLQSVGISYKVEYVALIGWTSTVAVSAGPSD